MKIMEIKDIIEIIDRHTMTAGLIAKYLRTTDESPGEFLESLMKKEGIANTKDINIRHKKDRRLRIESINQHLLVLFDLSGFSEPGCELIRSLSLMGYVRIFKKKFLEYCPVSNCINELDNLIHKGWIEYTQSGTNRLFRSDKGNQYDVAVPEAHKITLTLNNPGEFVLTSGRIRTEHLGSGLIAHRNIDPAGLLPNLNASVGDNEPYFSRLRILS